MSEVIAKLEPSAGRRIITIALLAFAGGFLLYLTMTQTPESLFGKLLLPAVGIAFLWLAQRNWSASKQGLDLTNDGLVDYAGNIVCEIDNIEKVDRSVFAFKPSNGFLVRLKKPMGRGWVPGIWWRFGRSVGIGGATPGPHGKQMADILQLLVVQRREGLDGFGD